MILLVRARAATKLSLATFVNVLLITAKFPMILRPSVVCLAMVSVAARVFSKKSGGIPIEDFSASKTAASKVGALTLLATVIPSLITSGFLGQIYVDTSLQKVFISVVFILSAVSAVSAVRIIPVSAVITMHGGREGRLVQPVVSRVIRGLTSLVALAEKHR